MFYKIVLLVVLLFLSGCVSTQQEVIYEKYKNPVESKNTDKNLTKKKPKDTSPMLHVDGIVKGVVSSVSYDGKWRYDVVGSDTTNGKLSHARFYSDKKAFSKGDEVYAIFKNSILKEFYLLKKANIKTKTNLKKQKAKVKKSTTKTKKLIKKDNIKGKKHKVLSVPITESIELD